MGKQLLQLGLRRSGTSTVFRLLRQDPALTCFDEPFNAEMRDMPGGNQWGSQDEFLALFQQDSARFWAEFATVEGLDELRDDLSPRQASWLKFLTASAENVYMDFTRCNFKVPALHDLYPDAVMIHLYRSPMCLASSHLLPSIWLHRRKIKYWRAKRKFWKTTKKYNFWGLETLIGRHPRSLFGHRLKEAGMDPEAVFKLPAVGRLLAFWRVNYEVAERDGRACFGDRFFSVFFDDFCRDPVATMAPIYDRLGLAMPALDTARIGPPNPPAFAGDRRWIEMLDAVGIDDPRFRP